MDLRDLLPQVVNKLLYICYFSLGIYWFCVGDAFEKYLAETTHIAESSEAISELPTIRVFVKQIQKAEGYSKYAEDFNISYSTRIYSLQQIQVNLTFGENIIPGSSLKVLFEEIITEPGTISYKITPIDFSPGKSLTICNASFKSLLHI